MTPADPYIYIYGSINMINGHEVFVARSGWAVDTHGSLLLLKLNSQDEKLAGRITPTPSNTMRLNYKIS